MNEPHRETEQLALIRIALKEARDKSKIPDENGIPATLRDVFTTINTLVGIINNKNAITENQTINIGKHLNSFAIIIAYYKEYPSDQTRQKIWDRLFKEKEGIKSRLLDLQRILASISSTENTQRYLPNFIKKVELTLQLIDTIQ